MTMTLQQYRQERRRSIASLSAGVQSLSGEITHAAQLAAISDPLAIECFAKLAARFDDLRRYALQGQNAVFGEVQSAGAE